MPRGSYGFLTRRCVASEGGGGSRRDGARMELEMWCATGSLDARAVCTTSLITFAPFFKGGETDVSNCQSLQSRVNRLKGNKDADEHLLQQYS
ncbi:uncharacterized protein LOC112341404 isoform X2 [Selaginella moellendorffii]|uniref:uncharacterized protein LOC112341404 isoform X2 n=1 Tax=Selaginella moellendorffii TaxID=88036 RepID=UPI000D1C35B3|nr:uncharacterized protein LOC112341404 isoform X2 [Selaginella moellendorffii]|eukprot:XP_024517199.1 uncharacterized protein LOC112341404 isoform X2 [Selaginella moellendorffii]